MDNYFEQLDTDIQEKPINWREIFETILYNWKWFVLSVILALIAGALYVRTQPDIFQTKSSILIIDQARNGQMNEVSLLKQLDAAGLSSRSSYAAMNNEEQVIKSTLLMRKVVKRLELYTSYSQRVFLKDIDLYTSAPLYVHLDSVSLAKLSSALVMEMEPDKGKLIIHGEYAGNKFMLTIKQLPAVLKTPAGMLYVQLRPDMQFPENTIIVTINAPVKVTKAYQNALTTEVGKMIDVIDISVTSTNAQKAKDILNTLADIYNEDAAEQNNLSAVNTKHFIDNRLILLTGELTDVEKNVENYKQANQLTDISDDAKIFLEKNSTYEARQIEVEMQQNLISYVDEFIKAPANKNTLIPNLGISDPGLMAVINDYNQLIMQRNRIAAGSSDANPALITINQQIESTRKTIQTGIAVARKALQINNQDLAAQNNLMQNKIREIPRQEREFIEIKRQQQVKESLYLFLLQKREEAALNMAINVPKSRVLNTPDEVWKTAPKSKMLLAVFMLIGLIIPGVILYIKELVNTKIRYRSDVEKLSDIPVLTELAHNDNGNVIIDHKTNNNSNAELFRLMRTKLQFVLDYPTEKVILVTSTMSGEGKTFVSINISIMLSLMDKKVLLMGMDLRRPQLAKHFDFDSQDGITSYLSGLEPDYKKLIVEHNQFSNLYILPSGIIPPNPTELIMKERFETLMNALKEEYDYIVIDTAPVGAVSDTFLIDRLSDITLYITRSGITDKRNVEFVNRINLEKSLKRIYFIVNDVDVTANRYAYHSRYGYGYGYGYGYKEAK
ncbi:MAG: polysaccharide biosynthesis tyrosine autokinase [Paludibacter sp.]|nr:polysaccharide biosynthesis tyrosine autokinase [Paludibacter sp.]